MNETITLIIPTFNERDNIVPLVERIHQTLSDHNYTILFIDDNSRDGTSEIAQSLATKYPVEVIVRKDKRGLASAVVDGIKHARGNIIGVMDADLQHPPEVLPELIKTINDGAEIAIASRYVKGGGCEGWSLTRRIVSKVAVAIAHLFLPKTRRFKDPMSGFFMFRRPVVTNADLNPTGYKILLEILMLGQYQNITEVPYIFKTRSKGESKLSTKTQVAYLKHVFSLMHRTGELLRFVKFGLVGFSGIFVNEGLLWLLVEFGGLIKLIAAAISIETSIISNFLLNNFFTFSDRRPTTLVATLVCLLKFNIASLGGLFLNMGIFWFLTDVVGIYYLLSNLVGIAAAALLNYILSTGWTWK